MRRSALAPVVIVSFLLAALALPANAGGPRSYDEVAADLRELLTALVEADMTNPPGNEARATAILARRLGEAGIDSTVTEFAAGRANLVARLEGGGDEKPLLLLAHTDVVGARGQKWSTDPYVLTERDGFLYGRGVADDLGMTALIVETAILLRESGTKLRRDVILALTGDEESGGDGIRHLLETKPDSIHAGIALNEGGGIVLREDGTVHFVSLQVAEKTYQDFELRVTGPTGHSSVPLRDNAIVRLARALERIGAWRAPARILPVTRAYFEARAKIEPARRAEAMRAVASADGEPPKAALEVLEADPILDATLRTTCVPTLVSGGTRVNALPAEAAANVNCRILPDESVDSVRETLVRIVGDDRVEIRATEDFGSGPPSATDHEVPAAIGEIVGQKWPGTPIIPHLSLGATDSRFLRSAGVEAYGFNPIAVTETDARRAHGIDERIPVASLRAAVEVFHRLVVELAGE